MACLIPGVACDSSAGEEPVLRGIPAECTVLEPGEPVALAADAHVIAYEYGGRAAGSLTRSVLSDGGDVYWYDYYGTVFLERQGDGPVVEPQRAEPSSGSIDEAGLGLAANAPPIGAEPVSDDVPLTRVDLASGALAYLTMPGFTPSDPLQLVGHDETRLFLRTSSALVSVRKP